MNNVVFAVAKRELLHVALYRKNVLLRGLFFSSSRSHLHSCDNKHHAGGEIAFY